VVATQEGIIVQACKRQLPTIIEGMARLENNWFVDLSMQDFAPWNARGKEKAGDHRTISASGRSVNVSTAPRWRQLRLNLRLVGAPANPSPNPSTSVSLGDKSVKAMAGATQPRREDSDNRRGFSSSLSKARLEEWNMNHF